MTKLPICQDDKAEEAKGHGEGGHGVPIAMDTKSVPNHFGDIMSYRETSISFPIGYSPIQRVLLSANGNLQRVLR